MNLTITIQIHDQTGLTNLLNRLYNPNNLDFHQFLSVSQFTKHFNPTRQDYQAVIDFAKSNGFSVTGTPRNRLLVDINGTVEQIQRTFHINIMLYQHPTENRTFYSPDREPSLDLNVRVAHIAGLDNFS